MHVTILIIAVILLVNEACFRSQWVNNSYLHSKTLSNAWRFCSSMFRSQWESIGVNTSDIRLTPKDKWVIYNFCIAQYSAGNNFSLFTGHMSFQIVLLVGHLTNWAGHKTLTDNALQKITQEVLVRCSVIMSDHNVKLAGHFQNLVGQCPMTDCYFQHWQYHVTFRLQCKFKFIYIEDFCCCFLFTKDHSQCYECVF